MGDSRLSKRKREPYIRRFPWLIAIWGSRLEAAGRANDVGCVGGRDGLVNSQGGVGVSNKILNPLGKGEGCFRSLNGVGGGCRECRGGQGQGGQR